MNGLLQSRLRGTPDQNPDDLPLDSNTPGMDVTIPLPGIMARDYCYGHYMWMMNYGITHGHKGSVFILRSTAIKS